MSGAVLCDTSFLVNLLDCTKPYHQNAQEYYDYFVEKSIILNVSIIAIAEFCIKNDYDDILKTEFLIPVGYDEQDALQASKFGRVLFKNHKVGVVELEHRCIIHNDIKLFASAENKKSIKYYISSDKNSISIYDFLNKEFGTLNFKFINFKDTKVADEFGLLFTNS